MIKWYIFKLILIILNQTKTLLNSYTFILIEKCTKKHQITRQIPKVVLANSAKVKSYNVIKTYQIAYKAYKEVNLYLITTQGKDKVRKWSNWIQINSHKELKVQLIQPIFQKGNLNAVNNQINMTKLKKVLNNGFR